MTQNNVVNSGTANAVSINPNGCCQPTDPCFCGALSSFGGMTPTAIRITMSCFVNGDCDQCTDWNGTFDVPLYPNCGESSGLGSSCGYLFASDGCSEIGDPFYPAILVALTEGGGTSVSVNVQFVTDFQTPSSPLSSCFGSPPCWGYYWAWNGPTTTCNFTDVPLYWTGYNFYCGPGPGCIYPGITADGLHSSCTWTTPAYPESCCTATALF